MASTVLPNGIIIPEKFSRDWYNDLYHNWQELDNLLGGGIPKDGTLTIQKNGTTVGTFSANQSTNETVNIEVPDVNDATLTIQKNGTTVDTFTANSSTDKTVDITVPTKTSDLTNDSNFVQSSDLATVATSGSYNDLSNKPTIPTVNNATLTIQKNGTNVQTFTANQSTNATANITVPTKTSDLTNDSGFITSDNTKIPLSGSNAISGSLIPATTDAYDLGGSSYQWNNAYIKSLTINGVACGDILTHNASEFVGVSGNQTIGGLKAFSTNGCKFYKKIVINHDLSYSKNTPPSQSAYHNLMFTDASGWWGAYIENVTSNDGNSTLAFYIRNTNETQSRVYLKCGIDGSFSMYPLSHNVWDLGISTNKWKSFNGINPGALSLPGSTYISLDTTNFDVTANIIGAFTPTVDGWAILSMSQKNKHFGIWIIGGTHRVTFHSVYHNSDYMIFALMPVRANVTMTVYCTADDIDSTRKVDWLKLFPCQGNV